MTEDTVTQGLGSLLADSTDLYLRYKGYHWNVGGPLFYEFHLLFDEQAKGVFRGLDLLGERLRARGKWSPYGMDSLAPLRTIPAETEPPGTVREMLERLAAIHRRIGENIRRVAGSAGAEGDIATGSLLSELLGDHEKMEWFLRETLSGRAPGLEHKLTRT